MSKYNYDNPEVKRLSKFLIPVNIVVAILCIVAAVSIIFAPIIQVDVGKAMQTIMDTTDDSTGSSSDSSDEVTTLATNIVGNVIEEVDFKISLSAWNMNELSTTENPSGYIIKTVLIDSGLMEGAVLAGINMGAISSAVNESLNNIVRRQIEAEIGAGNVTEEDENHISSLSAKVLSEVYSQFDLAKLNKIIRSFSNKAKDVVISEYTNEVKTQANNVEVSCSDDKFTVTIAKNSLSVNEANISEVLTPIYNYGTANDTQSFSIETAVCTAFADVFEGMSEGEVNIPTFKSYEEMIEYLTDPDSGVKDVEQLNSLVEGLSSVNDTLSESMQYIRYVFYVFLGFAGLWLILFLFAFIRIFLKNKRFMMWYVKLLGWIPGIIFVAIKALGPIMKAVMSASEAEKVIPILACISSGMWIPMACYIALWVVSIFWAFPIKHKIRKELKNS